MSLRHTVSLYDRRASRLTTAPTVEPVTADELRTHLNETTTGLPDAEAEALVVESRQLIEDHYNIALITQSWTVTMDRWPNGAEPWWDGVRQGHMNVLNASRHLVDVEMPRWPLQTITSVKTYAEDSTETTVTIADTFDVDARSIPGRVTLQRGATWPVAMRVNNAIAIEYIAGYGTAATDIPAPIKRAVKQLASALYSNRGDCDMKGLMDGSAAIMATYKVQRV